MENYQAMQRARQAAAMLFDDIAEVSFLDEAETGERRYCVLRRNSGEPVTVTLNPNGRKAAVEWKSDSHNGSGYRVFHLQGIVHGEPKQRAASQG